MNELLDCPFCGSKPETPFENLRDSEDMEDAVRVWTMHHHCRGIDMWIEGSDAEECGENWNCRTAPQALAATPALEHLGNAVYFCADIHPDDRNEALDNALAYYNEQMPRCKVEPSGHGYQRLVDPSLAATPAVGGEALSFGYTNWHGLTSYRRVRPISIRYGTSEYHKHAGWLMLAFDLDKNEQREFAMRDMVHVEPANEIPLAAPPASPLRGREWECANIADAEWARQIKIIESATNDKALSDTGRAAIHERAEAAAITAQRIASEIRRLPTSPPEQPAAETRQQKNEREMAEGSRCDGSCNDGMPCHCQPAADPATGRYGEPVWPNNESDDLDKGSDA